MNGEVRFADGIWNRSCTLLEAGQVDKAIIYLKRLLQLELPVSLRVDASLLLADALRMKGEYLSARQHVKAALASDPDDAALHHMLGHLHDEDESGNRQRALKHLRQAVKLAPDSSECHRALGDFLFQNRNSKRGLEHLKTAVELDPDNLDHLRNLIQALVEEGKEAEARKKLQEIQFRMGKAHPTVQSLWNELAYAVTLRSQNHSKRISTVPLLKAVPAVDNDSSDESDACILRFDSAHSSRYSSKRKQPRPRKK